MLYFYQCNKDIKNKIGKEDKMRTILVLRQDLHKAMADKYVRDIFSKLLGCVSFWNSEKLDLRKAGFQLLPMAR